MWQVLQIRALKALSVIVLLGCTGALSVAAAPYEGETVTVIKHYDKGYSPLLRVYLTEVLRTVLDKTTPEYGPYELDFYGRYLSPSRAKLETEKGELVQILFAPHWLGNFVRQENVIEVKFPVFKGMLGLRNLIADEALHSTINTHYDEHRFTQLSAGLGSNWVDVEIFRSNGIQVIEGQLFSALFPMLTKARFSYLPLSILEAQTALQTQAIRQGNLKIHESVMIFYPLPFNLYINYQKPELAERFSKGLEIAINDGTIEKLFEKHFGYVKHELESTRHRLVIIDNPHLNHQENALFIDQFLTSNRALFEVYSE